MDHSGAPRAVVPPEQWCTPSRVGELQRTFVGWSEDGLNQEADLHSGPVHVLVYSRPVCIHIPSAYCAAE